jgi:hypothetical protein
MIFRKRSRRAHVRQSAPGPDPSSGWRRPRKYPIPIPAAIAGVLVVIAALVATPFVSAGAATPAASTTSFWSTQLQFDSNGAAWSESYFAGLKSDGLTTAELDLPWGTIEPEAGTFSFTIWDQDLANAAAAGIQLVPIFWSSGWGGSPAPWITDFEKSSTGAAGAAPDWWNSTEQSEYFTYVEDTVKNSLAQPGGYGGSILDYGYLDAQWDLNGSGGGYTTDDIAEFDNVYLPDTYGTIATFNTDEGTSYSSFSQVPAEASGASLFGVFQAFRAWSVQQTYGLLTSDVRAITASTPLYYYYGGGYGNATNYANNPDTFFKLAKQYNVTFIADSASNTGMTLALTSLGRAYGVKVAEEWTAPSSNSDLPAYAVQWLDSYGMTFPQEGGEDFFMHDGSEKDVVGFPIYISWLPTLKTFSGSYPQQPVALYMDVSQGYGNTSGGSLSSVQTDAATIWDGFQSGLDIVTSQEVNNGAIKLSSFKAVLPLNGVDANLTSYKNGGGTLLTSSSQVSQYATAYATLSNSGIVQVVPVVSSARTSAQLTLADINASTAYNDPITINPTGLGLASDSYHLVNASGTVIPQAAVSGGLCAAADLSAASLTEWSVVSGAIPSGTAAPSACGGTSAPPSSGTLTANQQLTTGQALLSANGDYGLNMQGDGNLVLYQGSTALWSSGTSGTAATRAVMQGDGNFVLYSSSGAAVWSSGTSGNSGAYLEVQNDGNVVIYSATGSALWSTGTAGK